MKQLKIFYLSSEIHPFSNTYELSKFSTQFSSYLNDQKDIDIRLCQPKYGYISERKYILREVIRLKDLKIDFLDNKYLTNLKSAFIPETRVQIYFMEHPEYFSDVQDLLYKSRNGRFFKNNFEKFLFFAYTSFETLKKLFWVPDIIVCNDWQMSVLPLIYKQKYQQDDLFKNIKIVSLTHSFSDNYNYPTELFKKLDLPCNKKSKTQNAFQIARTLSDKNYIIDYDKTIVKAINRKKENKKILSDSKGEIIDNYQDFMSSEKIELFNHIIQDLKNLI